MSKRKIKFNLVDVLIILLVGAALSVFAYVFLSEKEALPEDSQPEKKIRYVLQTGDVSDEFIGNIKVGDTLYEVETDKVLGKVVAVSSEGTYVTTTNTRDRLQTTSKVEGKSMIFITLEANAKYQKNRYTVNGIDILVGGYIRTISPELNVATNIVSVEITG